MTNIFPVLTEGTFSVASLVAKVKPFIKQPRPHVAFNRGSVPSVNCTGHRHGRSSIYPTLNNIKWIWFSSGWEGCSARAETVTGNAARDRDCSTLTVAIVSSLFSNILTGTLALPLIAFSVAPASISTCPKVERYEVPLLVGIFETL